jgi:hypothetical protein
MQSEGLSYPQDAGRGPPHDGYANKEARCVAVIVEIEGVGGAHPRATAAWLPGGPRGAAHCHLPPLAKLARGLSFRASVQLALPCCHHLAPWLISSGRLLLLSPLAELAWEGGRRRELARSRCSGVSSLAPRQSSSRVDHCRFCSQHSPGCRRLLGAEFVGASCTRWEVAMRLKVRLAYESHMSMMRAGTTGCYGWGQEVSWSFPWSIQE